MSVVEGVLGGVWNFGAFTSDPRDFRPSVWGPPSWLPPGWQSGPLTRKDTLFKGEPTPLGTADLCIGKPSQFDFSSNPPTDQIPGNEGGGGVTVTWPPEDQPEDDQVDIYDEITRTESKVRVTNPQDEDSWVEVMNIETIDFRGPDGRTKRFIYHTPDSGGTSDNL